MSAVRVKPRMRGVSHEYAFYASLLLGLALVVAASGTLEHVATAAFAGSVAAMFGVSALYHRITWPPATRRWLCRLDHAMIYTLIAGSYTAFGLLVLSGMWRVVVLTVVWSGCLGGALLKASWVDAPKWLDAVICVGLGWVGVAAYRQFLELGTGGVSLVVASGVCYTLGAVVYARKRPDPVPAVFGYHEIFHVLVIAAVACQYVAVAFFAL